MDSLFSFTGRTKASKRCKAPNLLTRVLLRILLKLGFAALTAKVIGFPSCVDLAAAF